MPNRIFFIEVFDLGVSNRVVSSVFRPPAQQLRVIAKLENNPENVLLPLAFFGKSNV